ncbi:MAG: hypothetical protein ACE5HX_15685 [bacterium]
MKIILQISISCDGSGGGYLGFVRKEYQSEVTPFVGLEIENPAWFGPRRVNSVVLNLEENYYLVTLEDEKLEKAEEHEKVKKRYKKQGWKPD